MKKPNGKEAVLPVLIHQVGEGIRERLEALVTEWLDEMRAIHGEDAALHEKLLRRYL
jgi:hypothetical protein